MLRLKSPGKERLLVSPLLEVNFWWRRSERSYIFGEFWSRRWICNCLPDNSLGDACLRILRGRGVDVSRVIRSGDRIGIYFLEEGANQRPSSVIYDRSNSSIATLSPDDVDWKFVFEGCDWFHITGITPALSSSAADLSLIAVKTAKELGFDCLLRL